MEYAVPKYYSIKKDIIRRINAEEWGADCAIQSERELMENYGVSRITVRRAIDELVNEGYLYREQGKGTFVKSEQHRSALTNLSSCTEEILRQGMKATRRLNFARMEQPSKKMARDLSLGEADRIFTLQRVYFADDIPVSLTTTSLAEKFFSGIDSFNFEMDSLYRVLESYYRIRISRATRTVEAILAFDEIAEQLDVQDGFPLLLFRATTFAQIDGLEKPFEYFESYYRTDRMKFFIDQIR